MTNPEEATLDACMQRIREWHDRESQREVGAAFELGDLIVGAVIRARLTEYEVIRRIRSELGVCARSPTTYQRAARFVRVFTRAQRGVLVAYKVPLNVCETLASREFDKRRVKLVHAIKSRKLTAPWSRIRSKRQRQNDALAKPLRDALGDPEHFVAVYVGNNGTADMSDGFACLLQRATQKRVVAKLNEAVERLNLGGESLAKFALKGEYA